MEFNRGIRAKAAKQVLNEPQAINDKIQFQPMSEEVVINETKTEDQFRLPDTVKQNDVVALDVTETVCGSVSMNPKGAEIVQSGKKYRLFYKQKSNSTDRSQAKPSTRMMNDDNQRTTKAKKMDRSEFGSELVNFMLLLVVVGLVVLGVVFPEVGAIMLIILVIVLVAFIAWLFLEIFLGILEILTFSWL